MKMRQHECYEWPFHDSDAAQICCGLTTNSDTHTS